MIAAFPGDDAEQVRQRARDLGVGHENRMPAVHEAFAEVRHARIGVGHRHVQRDANEFRGEGDRITRLNVEAAL